jgi:hypothetical protein
MTLPRHRNRANLADMARGFGAIDAMMQRLAEGWTHEIDGRAAFRDPVSGQWYEIAPALDGWIALWERLDRHYTLLLDLDPMRTISARLAAGEDIPPELVDAAVALVTACKRAYRRMDMYEVKTIVRTQLIANAADAAGLTQEAHA